MKRTMLVAVALLTAILLTACATQTTVPQATATFCQSLTALDQAVASLDALGTTATVGQVKDAQKAVDQAFEASVVAAAQVKAVKLNELEAAQKDLQQTVNSIPDSATVTEAKATVAPKILAVANAAKAVRTSAQCP
jgi:hypothetical protein